MYQTQLFSAQGRISSRDYFAISLPMIFFVAMFLAMIFSSEDIRLILFGCLGLVPSGIILCFSTIRRLHDINLSGWFSLFILVAPLNMGLILYLWFKRGDKETNQYGNNPYALD